MLRQMDYVGHETGRVRQCAHPWIPLLGEGAVADIGCGEKRKSMSLENIGFMLWMDVLVWIS